MKRIEIIIKLDSLKNEIKEKINFSLKLVNENENIRLWNKIKELATIFKVHYDKLKTLSKNEIHLKEFYFNTIKPLIKARL